MTLDAAFEAFTSQAYYLINIFVRAVDALPVSYPFGAGMLASVNPCGFIMLPAFAAFYFTAGGADEEPGAGRRVGRALEMGGLVTLSFVVTFGLAGAVISAGGHFITRWIGWAGLAIGAALILLGASQLATRRSLFAGATAGIRVQRSATMRGVLLFGAAYAVASLSCTLPIFMTVAGTVFAGTGSYLDAVLDFLQYAAGLGIVLTAITLGIALFRHQTTRLVNRALPYVEATGNVLLVFAGGYLIWYWTALGGLA